MSGIKAIALLKRKTGLSKAEFIDYYEAQHAPLITSLFPTITAYRRNYTDFEGAFAYSDAAPLDFDVVTEIEFADRAGYDDMLARAADPATGQTIAEDEEHFLNRSHTRMFVTETRSSAVGLPT